MKTLSSDRATKLQASLAWQQFHRDADEVRSATFDHFHNTSYNHFEVDGGLTDLIHIQS